MKAKEIAEYYDRKHESYMNSYGKIIQAFRPLNDDDLINYLIHSIGIEDTDKILDAGCGIGGPAIEFSKRKNIQIEGITISNKQFIESQKLQQEHLNNNVNIIQGDYHSLSKYYQENSFDKVIFLESLGHSENLNLALKQASYVLKNGGVLYIKDFYQKAKYSTKKQGDISFVINNINISYAYNVMRLESLIKSVIDNGFEIDFIKKFDFNDDINIRSDFEEKEHIRLYKNEEFPAADWLEARFINIG